MLSWSNMEAGQEWASWEVAELLAGWSARRCDWVYERGTCKCAGAEQCRMAGVGLLLQSSKALEPTKILVMSVTEPTFWTRHTFCVSFRLHWLGGWVGVG